MQRANERKESQIDQWPYQKNVTINLAKDTHLQCDCITGRGIRIELLDRNMKNILDDTM